MMKTLKKFAIYTLYIELGSFIFNCLFFGSYFIFGSSEDTSTKLKAFYEIKILQIINPSLILDSFIMNNNNNNAFILLFFTIISLIILVLFIIFSTNIIYSIIYFLIGSLIFSFCNLILGYEFITLAIIIIYVGSICILLLFQAKLISKIIEQNYSKKIFLAKNFFFVLSFLIIIILFYFFIFIFLTIDNNIYLQFQTLLDISDVTNFIKSIQSDKKKIYLFSFDNNTFITPYWVSLYFNVNFEFFSIFGIFLYNIMNIIYLILGGLILLLAMVAAIILLLK